jgi:dienelactone hydrolase
MPETIALTAPDGTPLAAVHSPARAGAPGVVIVPGLGSRKDNHADFAAAASAAGMAALALDVRGHGESGGALGPGALDDVLAAVEWLGRAGHPAIGLRGSSMGGWLALHAAPRDPRVRAVVAICPARPEGLARRLGEEWPLALPLAAAVGRPDGVARAYWHATGDASVPFGSTLALAGRTPHPMRLRVALGGSHNSLQHDPAVIAESAAFLAGHLAR